MKFYILISVFLCISIHVFGQRLYFSGGYYYSTFICSNNSLYSWGDNEFKQLARDNSTCNYHIPCLAPSVEHIISIDGGYGSHTAAITSNKRVITWGKNYFGELGSGSFCGSGPNPICERTYPDTVVGGETGFPYLSQVVSIASGQAQIYALLQSGEVVAWGNNSFGQLGDGTYTNRADPVYVIHQNNQKLQNIKMIAAGLTHIYALTNGGEVYAWGSNIKNQLGTGNDASLIHPQKVVDSNGNPLTNITSIAAGSSFGIFLRSNGFVYGAGAYKGTDLHHVTGTPIYSIKKHAELISGGATPHASLQNVVAISAGYNHALAVVVENNQKYVVSWGDNRFPDLASSRSGALGIGAAQISQSLTPRYMLISENTRITDISSIHAGVGVSYIETYHQTSGTNRFYVSGINNKGQLGTKDFFDRQYLTRIDENLCEPICAGLIITNSYEFCTPFSEHIESGLSEDDYQFAWFYNNVFLPHETGSNLPISNPGTYNVVIIDKMGACITQTSEITVSAKEKEFEHVQNSYCGSSLLFKVAGEGDFVWYDQKNGTQIGSGNYLEIDISNAETVLADSIYQVWLEKENVCQQIPLQIVKNCNCSPTLPIVFDTTACVNRDFFVRALGDSIVWYHNADLLHPFHIGEIYHPKNLNVGSHTLYATNILHRCESSAQESALELIDCNSLYVITGQVFAEQHPQGYSRVFLYPQFSSQALDSCISNKDGVFTLFVQQNEFVTALAYAQSDTFYDTWLGNKTSKQYAHYVFADAYIGGLEIRMQQKAVHIETISLDAEIIRIDIILPSGQIIQSCESLTSCISKLEQGMFFLRIIYKNGKSELRTVIK